MKSEDTSQRGDNSPSVDKPSLEDTESIDSTAGK